MLAGAISVSGSAFQPGSLISQYRVLNVLGQGGMGIVYEVKNESTGTKRALKMLYPSFSFGEILKRFDREAVLGVTLNHGNIVEIVDSGKFDRTPYLVMERLYGQDLAARLKSRTNRAMTFEETYPILSQVMDALEYAHGKGIVHRDLKPENIFVCDGEPLCVKLLDFGIAKLREQAENDDSLMTQDGRNLGTPTYMSPEQALGYNSKIDHRTDIWALGAITYYMLTGQKPFTGKTAAEIMMNIANKGVVPPRLDELVNGIPAGTQAMVDRAMYHSRDGRFGSIREFRAALEGVHRAALTARHPTPASVMRAGAETAFTPNEITPTARTITMTPRRRRRTGLWLTLAFLTLAGGAGAAYYLGEPHVVALVNRVIREGEKLLEEHGLKQKKSPPPRVKPMQRVAPKKPGSSKKRRRKYYPHYRYGGRR